MDQLIQQEHGRPGILPALCLLRAASTGVKRAFSACATLLLCLPLSAADFAAPKDSASGGRQEFLLSGEDWAIAPFEPGEGVKQRAFAEGYPLTRAVPATVPGDVHWDLERAGQLPPIYYGTNSAAIGWVAAKEWWYRKTFVVPAGWREKQVWLRFDAVDYLAEVWLNGQLLGHHEGQFTPFEFEVAQSLQPGATNVLTVLIHPAPAGVREAIASGSGEWPVMTAMRKAYPRWKCQTNAGWDWGAKIITLGIWQEVRLIATDGVRLSNLTVQPQLAPPYSRAVLHLNVDAWGPRHPRLKLAVQARCLASADPPAVVEEDVVLPPAGTRVALRVTVPRPRLWWPNGYGPQPLYELAVTARDAGSKLKLDQAITTFGIRDLQMLPNPEAPDNRVYVDYTTDNAVTHQLPQPPPERRYLIQINGRRIFARGGNWIPCDLLYGRPRQNAYEHLIRLAGQAHFNLFRVWGGGLIDKPVFYDLCDRYGIMLFQEFPNAGARLPETDEALAIAAQETREVLPLLINHPCMVRYGGANEWYRNAANSRQMAQLRKICNELDPTRPFHDPDPECIAQRHGPHAYDFGTHYQVFNSGYPLSAGPDNPLEWTEYGASGASGVETLRRILPAGHLWPIRSSDPHWRWHKAFDAFGPDNWMGSAQYLHLFGELADLETTVRCSQWVQAEGLRYANQAMRRHEWHRSACAFWTYNEPWPNAAHGCVVEYYGQPKMAYYYTRNSYAPVDVSAEYSALTCQAGLPFPLKLFVASDQPDALKGCRLTATAMDTHGQVYDRRDWRFDLAPEAAVNVGAFDLILPQESAGNVVLVHLRLCDSKGKDLSVQTYTFGVTGQNGANGLAALRVPAVSPEGRRNLALLPGVKAAASSVIAGYAIHQVAHLNDGWYGNEASWIQGQSPAWAQIDLGAVHTISRVCLGNDHTLKYKDNRGIQRCRVLAAVEYRDDSDASTWRTVASYQGEPMQGGKVFDFEPLKARWIRVDIAEGPGARIDEIEVYEAGPLPADQAAQATANVLRGPPPPSPAQVSTPGSLRALLTAPATKLKLSLEGGTQFEFGSASARRYQAKLENVGEVPALFIKLDTDAGDTRRCHVADSGFTLLPGETRRVDVVLLNSPNAAGKSSPTRLRAQAWNSSEVSRPLGILSGSPRTRSF